MAGEEVYIARMGAWIARALGETGGFATDLDGEALGFQLPDAVVNDAAVAAAGLALGDAGAKLIEAADELETGIDNADNSALASGVVHFIEGVYLYVDAMNAMVSRIEAVAATLPVAERNATQAFAALMARKAIDFAVISLLEKDFRRTLIILKMLGLLERRTIEPTGALNEPRFVRKRLYLERLKDLFNNPQAHFANVHGWGTAAFDPAELMNDIMMFEHDETSMHTGRIGGDAFIRSGPALWRRDSSVNPPGLLFDYSARIAQQLSKRAKIDDSWGSDVSADLAIESGAIFKLRPPFQMSAEPKAGTASGAFRFIVNRNPEARGFTIVDGNDLVRLTAEDFGIGAELVVGASTTGVTSIDPGVFSDLKGLTLTLGSEGSDNFLASLLANADVEGSFDLGLGWTLSKGLVVRAAGGLEIAIPMHQSLGIATLETLYLIVKIREDGSFALEVSATITGNLSVLTAAVERMGIELVVSFSDRADAALGPLDLALKFKPPNGVGLALDAGVVRGGGYLYLDFEKGEYAGALELTFSGLFSVKAIGLISTKMPDGSDGFSLLVVITAEFGVPIQLGFGFTLIGLGGLLGLNRTMMLQEMAEGVRTGSIENVMFPRDVIANAPQIISDMKRFFPPKAGSFLIGPMAKIGWGTPTLISVSLGVIIEIPPGNIAILGVIKCALPSEDAPILLLQVKFIGAIEPTKSRLWFFASLYGSRILFITLSGDMGLLIAWGDNPNFVLSVGGFHPKFTPPPLPFPTPQRICLSILDESFARIRVEAYFAVTSNTAQFGARAELFFGLRAFSIEGHIGFDALFQFSPFYFVITISASVSVKVFGIGLFSVRVRGALEGPTPWHIEGEGSISVLFFDLHVPFSHSWGNNADTNLPATEALPILVQELQKRDNWVALPPANTQISVSLRQIEATVELVLHPVGTLRVSQRALPLNTDIQKVGNKSISDISRASISITANGLVEKAKFAEPFAPAQYRNIEGAEKLSAPGFEKMDAGAEISVAGADVRSGHALKRVVLHELITIDNNYKQHIRRFYNVTKAWFSQLLSSNATARSALSQAVANEKKPFGERIKADEPGYVIALSATNTAWASSAKFASYAQAMDALTAERRANPKAANDLHVIPAAEARIAA